MNALSPYCGERFMQGVENVIGADDVAQAVAEQIGPQRRFRVYEHQRYAAADQVLLQVAQHSCGRIIDAVIAPASTTNHFTGGPAPSTRPRTSATKRPALA